MQILNPTQRKPLLVFFNDNAVDLLNTGVDEGKGIAFVEVYNKELGMPRDFNVGAGSWINDSLWLGIFYTNSNVFSSTHNKSVSREYTNLETGNPVVDIETTETDSITNTSALVNSVSVNFYDKDSEFGGEIYYTNKTNGFDKTDTNNASANDDSVSTAEKTNRVMKNFSYAFKNNFGMNFSGLKTEASGENDFYLALSNVDFMVNGISQSMKDVLEKTKYDDVINQGNLGTYSSKIISYQKIGGTVKGEFGFNLQDAGALSTSFVLEDEIGGYGTGMYGKQVEKYTNTTTPEKYTSEGIVKIKPTANFELVNTATPKFNFTFDAGSRVKVAANIKTPVALSYNVNSVDYYESVATTVVENLTNNTKTTKVETEQAVLGGDTNDRNTFSASVSPEINAGIVWAVSPDKFNLNFGVAANAGTYAWENVTTKASKRILKSKTVKTDEFGVETVTVDKETPVSTGNNTDTSKWTFNAAKANVMGSLGATVFFSDKASLDMALVHNGTNFGLGSLLTATTFDLLFSVKF